jgi:hypothetical protein
MPSFLQRLKAAFYGTRDVSRMDFPGRIGPSGRTSTPGVGDWLKGRLGIGTKIAAQYGHPDALLPITEIDRLFAGEWIPVASSWISAIQYNLISETSGTMYVRLIRGKEYGPTIVSPAEMGALASAPSKGHTVNKLWKRARGK